MHQNRRQFLGSLGVVCAALRLHAQSKSVVDSQMDRSLAEAKDLGILRIVGVSLTLAVRLLEATTPDSVLQKIQADATIPKLCDLIAVDIPESEAYSTESVEYFRLMLNLRERLSDRLRFGARLAFTPSTGEWDVVNLPAPLFPIYRVVRLFRVTRRLLSARS